ncbi:hypothetical protein BG261_06725 [Floricoccus tropicus]|uniref:MapZ extracellular domain-containing protein n=1 Tax=Floricoccus tropicus TaxID=1859473 RepID=A0A1E8GK18_9LACT|nr:hypothetical protein [Floricoccus tropicus]OFI48585.1 hypothetical protein BG261_06725 [Floricoccus tropicus]
MKNTLSKTLLLLIVGGAALAVCFFGYKAKSDSVRKQKIEYAQQTAKKESANIKAIKTRVEKFYVNSSHDTLLNNVSKENVKKEYDKLSSIKISAQDFGVPEKYLTSDVKELGNEKDDVLKLINDVQDKLNIQSKISDLFEGGIKDWQKEPTSDVSAKLAIKDGVKKETVNKLKEPINTKGGTWNKIASQYLNIANVQVDQLTDIETLISKMIKDGKITKDATTDNYALLTSKIDNIKNDKLKSKYMDQATNINSQMTSNVEATPVESDDSETPVESPSEEQETAESTVAVETPPVAQEPTVTPQQQNNNTVPQGQQVETPSQEVPTGNSTQSNTNQDTTTVPNDNNQTPQTNPQVPNQGNTPSGSGSN